MGQHVKWCDWLVTQNSRYWHHKIFNISCLNFHYLSQFMLKWSLYKHICLSAFFVIGVSKLLQVLKICVYHQTPNNRAAVSGPRVKWRSIPDGKPKYRWSVSRAFTVWLQAQEGDETECAIMQSVMLCDRLLCVWTVSGVLMWKVLTVTVFFIFSL
jgi:hypothetical protein